MNKSARLICFIALFVAHSAHTMMKNRYKTSSIMVGEYGIPQMPREPHRLDSSQVVHPYVNNLVQVEPVYSAYKALGYSDEMTKKIIQQYLESLAECQENFRKLKLEILRLEIQLHSAQSQQEFAIKRDAEVKKIKDDYDYMYQRSRSVQEELDEALKKLKTAQEELGMVTDKVEKVTQLSNKQYDGNKSLKNKLDEAIKKIAIAESDRKKLIVLEALVGAGVGGLLGLYVHQAALILAQAIDGLDEESAEEQRNFVMKLLTHKFFKPLTLISALLGAYGATKL
jgi:hypothetical protein